jgi:hypothetical protein
LRGSTAIGPGIIIEIVRNDRSIRRPFLRHSVSQGKRVGVGNDSGDRRSHLLDESVRAIGQVVRNIETYRKRLKCRDQSGMG